MFSLTSCVAVETPKINSPIKKSSKSIDEAKKLSISKNYGKLPLRFEKNNGQTDEQVKFLSRGNGYSMFLTPTEVVMVLSKGSKQNKFDPLIPQKIEAPEKVESSVVRMKLLDSNKTPKITGEEKQITKSNYLVGNDKSKWKTGVSNYGKVKYEEVYKGIDLVYYGNQRKLEYDFVVKPGADYKEISFSFAGADKVSIDEKGNLILKTATGEVVQKAPIIYQEIKGQRVNVAGNYIFLDDERVAFHLGDYDKTQELVIDPVLVYSTFLGGSGNVIGKGIVVDSVGNVYVTGNIESTDFPTTTGAFDETRNGPQTDVFVSKLNVTGSELVYSTFFGGSVSEQSNGIAVDSSGNVLFDVSQKWNV